MMQQEGSKERVLIVAAEASSSLYAQRLLEHWKAEGKNVEAFGIGSRSMEKLGFHCIGRSEELAVVGVSEVLAHFPLIRKVFHQLIEEAQKKKPQVVLLLDYPDFNFRLAKKLSKLGFKVVYYISPQIWAWRTSRIKLVQKFIDKMLVLFPFEKDFYKSFGVDVDFVGHPLLDELDPKLWDKGEIKTWRSKYGFTDDDMVVGLMPGSRKSELNHHLLTQLETAKKLHLKKPQLKFALLVAPHFELEELQDKIPEIDFPLTLVKAEPFQMIAMMDLVLVASGTATLMVGLMNKPMVIMYKMSAFTGWLAKVFVKSTKFFGLVNLVHQKEVAPELFQGEANPDRLASELLDYVDHPERMASTVKELENTTKFLGSRGITPRVAEALEPYFKGG